MDHNNFLTAAKSVLEDVANMFEYRGFDVEWRGEALYIEPEEERKICVIYAHNTTQQIWLSSPLFGAYHFTLADNNWLCTRSGEKLQNILAKEFSLTSV